nr:hypothetical protein KPHV_60500 [Kitasatospora purpeofusca]
MTSHYQHQLAQQLRAAEDELGQRRQQVAELTTRVQQAAEGIRAARALAGTHQQRAEQAEARITAVRALHQRFENRCGDCYNPDYPEPWPCPTIRALDGAEARP